MLMLKDKQNINIGFYLWDIDTWYITIPATGQIVYLYHSIYKASTYFDEYSFLLDKNVDKKKKNFPKLSLSIVKIVRYVVIHCPA